ncbi:MAG: aromatic ring-hydroxylating dioxygenase subunit alpha [Bryobacterales bacterium]|nr:aromatic ring-hydroxylating dioxygenase subunit alpha [Bryobacterales bacterium]MBV9401264.1 aromatic ring-hydroxylating dioxygenase subunit alpha [Bryobacterales bacterium]
MLDFATNQLLTQTSAGTPMGDLLRRYWMPIAAVSEFDHRSIKPVRLLGEDLTLYKDLSGAYGLVDRHCPHRRADMSYGFVEQCGLRCNYHGWLFDEAGRCTEQPYEEMEAPEARFKDRVRIKAYPVQTLAGLIWAYLGPEPAPLVPNWEPFTWKNGFVQIVFADIPCNWFQCQENSVDPVHFEWMHMNWSVRLADKLGPYSPRHLKLAFDEFDYGLVYRRIREGMSENDPMWKVGRVCLWPNALFTGDHFEWRVPVDDHNTLSVTWAFSRVPKEREPYAQERIPAWHGPVREAESGRWISSHVMNQDFVAWVGQGTVADRTKEHLGASDRGIIMLRKRFLSDLDVISRGEDPKATIRDPELNRCLPLPIAERKVLTEGLTREQLLNHPIYGRQLSEGYPFQLGQPEEVRLAYEDAMGVPTHAVP